MIATCILDGDTITIRKPCEADDGHWYCEPCEEHFRSNLGSNAHRESSADHRILWICHHHGPEGSDDAGT